MQHVADVHVYHGGGSTRSARAGHHHTVLSKVALKCKKSDFSLWSMMLSRTFKFFYALVGPCSTSAAGTPRRGAGGRCPSVRHRSHPSSLREKMQRSVRRVRVCRWGPAVRQEFY